MTTSPIPPTAVVRVSRGNFDPARFEQVHETTVATISYLVPAIKELPGLISYHAGTSPEHAQQMSRLKEMIVDTRQAYEKVGVSFIPIVNYPIDWAI